MGWNAPTDSQARPSPKQIAVLGQLLSISRQLNSTLQMRPLLQQIASSARELTDADQASILLVDDEGRLRLAATSDPPSDLLRHAELPAEGCLADWVVEHQQTASVEDARSDPRTRCLHKVEVALSVIATPVIFGDQVIGVIAAVTAKARRPFTDQDVDALEALASIGAVAVQNARLFQQSDWIAEVVHEIRTPLTAILSYTELLRNAEIDGRTRSLYLDIIERETKRVSGLATQFLELARLESGRIQMARDNIQMADIIQRSIDTVRATAEDQNRTLILDIASELPDTLGDAERIHQALLNLLANAIKYSSDGDTITVSASAEGAELLIGVSDTGPGIPAEQIPRLFHRFSRLPGNGKGITGTGLGLMVTRQIVEAHHGKIRVESKVGIGTTFYFTLPVVQPR